MHIVDGTAGLRGVWPEPDDRWIAVGGPLASLIPSTAAASPFTPEAPNLLVIDPPAFIAGTVKGKQVLVWNPRFNDLDTTFAHALAW